MTFHLIMSYHTRFAEKHGIESTMIIGHIDSLLRQKGYPDQLIESGSFASHTDIESRDAVERIITTVTTGMPIERFCINTFPSSTYEIKKFNANDERILSLGL